MPIKTPGLRAFHKHKARSAEAGIEFNFTFAEWCDWWRSQLGDNWLELKTGLRADQFCMARHGDVGPYSPSNVKCITRAKNSSEQRHPSCEEGPRAKLTREQVIEIRSSYRAYSREGNGKILSEKYGVTRAAIAKCVRGETWKDPNLLWAGRVSHSNYGTR